MSLVYFIPGTMCNEQLWGRLWPLLSSRCELVHLTLASEGELSEVVDDLVAQIKRSSRGRVFNLIGFSLGGYLASAVSLKFAEQLQRVMIIANTPMALPEVELTQRKRIIDTVNKLGYQGLNRSRVISFLDVQQHSDHGLIDLIQGMGQQFNERDLAHHLVTLSKRENLCSALAAKNRLLWFCCGESDHLVDSKKMRLLSEEQMHIQYRQVANSGHFLPLEKPRQLAALIDEWLTQETIDTAKV